MLFCYITTMTKQITTRLIGGLTIALLVGTIVLGYQSIQTNAITSPAAAQKNALHLKAASSTFRSFSEVNLPRSTPTKLQIPSINIDHDVTDALQVNPAGDVEVPDQAYDIGWLAGYATPGEDGTAVLVGHRDWFEGSAIFADLDQLKSGQFIEVDRADGTTVTFRVEGSATYARDAFPGRQVYAMSDDPTLVLITCDGDFDEAYRRYDSNLVVYASLVTDPGR